PTELDAPTRVRSKTDMLANLESKAEQVVDARSADRVFGEGIDPVHGGQNGRIPGSFNLPFGRLLNEDGTYKSPDAIRAEFETSGIDLRGPVVTSCGSGVTASVLAFGLHLIGKDDWALYDGSWSEWGSDPDTPKEQGPA
ncbi:MAG: rhodanese-like domain-containing protein, partial [Pseudomonadota bacterium]